MPTLVVNADRRDHGHTLAAVLKARFNLSWTQAKRIIERRHVRVGAQIVADAAYRVKAGKRISIAAGVIEQPKSASPAPKPQAPTPKPKPKPVPAAVDQPAPKPTIDIPILYSDLHIVVVNKPAGITTMRHADEAEEFGRGKRFLPKTVADWLPILLGEPGKPVLAVHRLDRETSGVLVFARTQAAAKQLTSQFRKHTTERRYWALVRGEPKAGRIESHIIRDRGDGRRGSVDTPTNESKRAVTHVQVRQTVPGFAFVECRLETGRTHQVRIHLGEAGTPLCGETVYDRPLNGRPHADTSSATRPMLHAFLLAFEHPITAQRMNWEVPLPQDFAALAKQLQIQYLSNTTK
jgi:23S rRNA pseudouridine1911/1915/1917 synthase